MYGYTRLWKDGNPRWIQKSNPDPKTFNQDLSFGDILTVTLVACDVKTDVPGESCKVDRNGTILKQFMVQSITSWSVDNNVMTVNSEDEVPFKLVFISASEALKADYRLFLIVNGAVIIECNDEVYFKCSKISNLSLSF